MTAGTLPPNGGGLVGERKPGEMMVELSSYQAVVVAAVRRSEEGTTMGTQRQHLRSLVTCLVAAVCRMQNAVWRMEYWSQTVGLETRSSPLRIFQYVRGRSLLDFDSVIV